MTKQETAYVHRCTTCRDKILPGDPILTDDTTVLCDGCTHKYEEDVYTPELGERYAAAHRDEFLSWLWEDLTELEKDALLRHVLGDRVWAKTVRFFSLAEGDDFLKFAGYRYETA